MLALAILGFDRVVGCLYEAASVRSREEIAWASLRLRLSPWGLAGGKPLQRVLTRPPNISYSPKGVHMALLRLIHSAASRNQTCGASSRAGGFCRRDRRHGRSGDLLHGRQIVRPSVPEEAGLRFLEVAVRGFDAEAVAGEAFAHLRGDHYRAVAASRAAERDRQVALPFADVVRQEIHQEL